MRTVRLTIHAPLMLLMLRQPTAESSPPTNTRRERGSVIRPPIPMLVIIPHHRPRTFERRTEQTRASTSPLERELERKGISLRKQ